MMNAYFYFGQEYRERINDDLRAGVGSETSPSSRLS